LKYQALAKTSSATGVPTRYLASGGDSWWLSISYWAGLMTGNQTTTNITDPSVSRIAAMISNGTDFLMAIPRIGLARGTRKPTFRAVLPGRFAIEQRHEPL